MNYESLLNCNPKAELARRNLIDFVTYCKQGYEVNWHHALLASYLDDFVKGKIKRLMVFMPPQHGKSELVSRNLPAFLLGKNPKSKIVLASYSAYLSSSFNRDCQRIIDSEEYKQVFPATYLNSSNVVTVASNYLRNSEVFETVGHGGFLRTVGVGGSLTGTPADFAIIDDPVKDSLEAMSATYQLRNWNWYNDVLYTRIHNNTGILVTQTRWHQQDLSGLLLDAMNAGRGEQWTVLNLPGIKENESNPEDPRKIGEALWESKHSIEKLRHVQRQSLRTFEALYQQNPRPVETGGEFYKQFRISRHVGKCPYSPDLPMHLTFDFNVNPYMAASIWQISNKKVSCIGQIRSESPNNTTKGVCKEFIRLYPGHSSGLFIYGDPAGRHEDTRSEKGHNDYRVIMTELAAYKPSLRVANKAPSVVMRGNFINTVLESEFGGLQIMIDEKCTDLINDFTNLKEDSDGTKYKEKGKDMVTGVSFERWGHFTDGFDYFFCQAFASEFSDYQRGGKTLNISMGKSTSKNSY